ncbi:putative Ig domain-containing protein [Kitasatospora sp. NPDC006697]|uniref:S53 family peptidase n=1 Tax=Kitasatospora sp. NPDC006697 TaxID=3364020 RepID=UPI00369715BD
MRRILPSGAAVLILAAAGAAAPAAPAAAAPAPRLAPASCATEQAGHAHCNAIQLVGSAATGAARPAAPNGYGPADIQSAYGLGTNPGSGQTVAVVDAYDDPNAESDLATYRSQFGLSACTTANGCFKKVDQRGGSGYPKGDTGWGTEITLDLDAVSAACPGCHILLVEADSNLDVNLGASVDEAVQLGAKFVSNSYSDSESDVPSGTDVHYNHPGVMIAAATGDYGSKSGADTQYPASSPTVVSIGGTSLRKAANTRGWTETVWGSSTAGALGTGSGCSGTYAKPSYQQSVNTSCAKRATSDVSAVADPQTGLAIYDSYGENGWLQYGGTSLATPVISSIWALAGVPGASDNPVAYPYAHADKFNDVTAGTNGPCGAPICTAGTGWDGPTGLGTPIGTAAFKAGNPPPPPANDFSVSLAPASGSAVQGKSVTSTVSTAVTAGSAVSVQLSVSGLPSGATATFSPATVTAGGGSTLTIGAAATTPTGSYPVTVTGTAGSTAHSAVYTLTVTGSGGGGTVTVANPGTQYGSVYYGLVIQINATDSARLPLTFTASGLPAGVSITPGGRISGTPTASGAFQVTVTASDGGGGTGSTTFTYQVF